MLQSFPRHQLVRGHAGRVLTPILIALSSACASDGQGAQASDSAVASSDARTEPIAADPGVYQPICDGPNLVLLDADSPGSADGVAIYDVLGQGDPGYVLKDTVGALCGTAAQQFVCLGRMNDRLEDDTPHGWAVVVSTSESLTIHAGATEIRDWLGEANSAADATLLAGASGVVLSCTQGELARGGIVETPTGWEVLGTRTTTCGAVQEVFAKIDRQGRVTVTEGVVLGEHCE